jgi:hypothetical protein
MVRRLKLVAAEVEEGADVSEAIAIAEAVPMVSSDACKVGGERAECENGVKRGRFCREDGW